METDFQTSFIPKKPLSEDRVEVKRPTSIVTLISIIIFIVALIATGGVYLYKSSLEKQKTTKKQQLELASKAFEKSLIDTLQTLDKRIIASEQILSKHIAVSPIFEALQLSTLKSIQYTKFNYELVNEGTNAKVNVKMSGKARDYNSIALQADEFTTNKYIQDVVFSNLKPDKKGYPAFDLDFSVHPDFVLYGENLKKVNATTDNNPVDNTTQGTVDENLINQQP
ncbi:MAG: hypothetical protein WDK96_02735 [Candidatus Paceibacterota bacterium]